MTLPVPIDQISIFEWCSIILMILVVLSVSLLAIYISYAKYIRNTSYRISLTILTVIFVTDQLFIGKYIQYFESSVTLLVIHYIFAQLIFLCVGWCATSVLLVYGVIIPSVTATRIKWIRLVMVVCLLWNSFLGLSALFTRAEWIFQIASVSFFTYMGLVIFYDEFQNIYLVVNVYKSLKSKTKRHAALSFKKLLLLNFGMMAIDALGIGAMIWAYLEELQVQRILFNLSTSLQGLHGFSLVYLYAGLVDLQFSDRLSLKPQGKPEVTEADTRKVSIITTKDLKS